jgi:hypothetical protein
MVLTSWPECRQKLAGIDAAVTRCEYNVPPATLGGTQVRDIDNSFVNGVARPPKKCGCRVDHLPDVVCHGRDVFDQNDRRPKDLRGSGHPSV